MIRAGEDPLPPGLEALGCNLSELPVLVERAMRQGAMASHPRALSKAEVEAFFRKAIRA